ncbi:glycerophosphoryl diester phosphodiesterase membrane domain-containing protein [Streptomyces sp. RFCAC02]|uniref:DUF7544 domain-containing protein n=1 Tax=Streptomyces sp. RFCAC02 TaxID=2499143 RepID=UPI001020AE5E|nr:glycerophosphoryl diester phosphodiesterase membrane domain-containing protein [Streptomyces sp. RFCAC02]
MSDAPGWVPPGSPPPEDGPPDHRPADPPPPAPPQAPQGWGQAPPPPPGWGGGQQGWAAPGWQPAASVPKPGVIPLRPLGVGEILDGAVATARTHWRTVLTVTLLIAVVTQLISAVAMRLWVDADSLALLQDDSDPTDEEIERALGDVLAYAGVAGVVAILGSLIATAMLTIVVSRAVLGRSVTVGEAWRDSRPRLLRLLGLSLLVPLIGAAAVLVPVTVGALSGSGGLTAVLSLAGVVLAVWLIVQYSLAPPALMLERQGVVAALRRSWKLVRGSWWRVFGVQLLMMVLIVIVSNIIQIPAGFLASAVSGADTGDTLTGVGSTSVGYLAVTGVGAVIASAITLPVQAGVVALLYMDQRIRREALDIELARAAGAAPSPGA